MYFYQKLKNNWFTKGLNINKKNGYLKEKDQREALEIGDADCLSCKEPWFET